MTGLPVGTIRERREGDTEDRFVGELGVIRETGFYEIPDEGERKKAIELNQSRLAGDPSILWTWFCESYRGGAGSVPIAHSLRYNTVLLHESYTGKGYITSVLRHLFSAFLVPHLNVYSIISYAFVGNVGSRAVHLKVGFVEDRKEWIKMPECRGGQMREEWVFRWTRKGVELPTEESK